MITPPFSTNLATNWIEGSPVAFRSLVLGHPIPQLTNGTTEDDVDFQLRCYSVGTSLLMPVLLNITSLSSEHNP